MSKKILIPLIGVMLFLQQGHAQPQRVYSENFDGATNTFTMLPANSWQTTTDFFVSPSKSIAGFVPNISGDSIVLTSPYYDLGLYKPDSFSVLLKFNHICKVSSSDITRIEFREGMQQWRPIIVRPNPNNLPVATYLGQRLII